jgi:hypothetical protein
MDWLELAFSVVIVVSCLIIVQRTHAIYRLSHHRGVRSFRDAFLFYGLAFIVRFSIQYSTTGLQKTALSILLYYLVTAAGFTLIYSLVWKGFPERHEYLLHIMALIIAGVSVLMVDYLMLVIQTAVFTYALVISYENYRQSKHNSLRQLYFIAVCLALVGFALNLVADFIPFIAFYADAVTAAVFLIFLLSVLRAQWPRKESA